jgi:hypothetical protein
MITDATRQRFPRTHWVLLERLQRAVEELERAASVPQVLVPTRDPIVYFNQCIRFAGAIYLEKFRQLYQGVALGLEQELYLLYAQAGRSILENVATLRYYAHHNDFQTLRGAWGTPSMSDPIIRRANDTVDRLLHGNRFSWDAFFEGRFDQLSKNPEPERLPQINVQTCLKQWYADNPKVEPLYDLMCDLVHPNLGSTFLVLRSDDGKVVAGGHKGTYASMFIIAPTLAGITGAMAEIKRSLDSLMALTLRDPQ